MFIEIAKPLAVACALSAGSAANAVVVIDILEIGTDVVATYDGTINLTGLPVIGLGSPISTATINPAYPWFWSLEGYDVYRIFGTMPVFGSGGSYSIASSMEGDTFGLESNRFIYLPQMYQSGDMLSGSLTFGSTDFGSIGLTPGTYTTHLGNGDYVVMNIDPPAPVPLPASLPLLLAGAGALGLAARRHVTVPAA